MCLMPTWTCIVAMKQYYKLGMCFFSIFSFSFFCNLTGDVHIKKVNEQRKTHTYNNEEKGIVGFISLGLPYL